MAIGSPRGSKGMRPVYIYDPAIQAKRYIGSFPSLEEARRAELAHQAAQNPSQGDLEAHGLRRCPGCRKLYTPLDEWQKRCSLRCETNVRRRERRKRAHRTDDHWVYTARDAAGDILYVGVTSTGLRRHREHGREMEWWPQVATMEIAHFDTRDAALAAEAAAIALHQPPFNTLGLPSEEAA